MAGDKNLVFLRKSCNRIVGWFGFPLMRTNHQTMPTRRNFEVRQGEQKVNEIYSRFCKFGSGGGLERVPVRHLTPLSPSPSNRRLRWSKMPRHRTQSPVGASVKSAARVYQHRLLQARGGAHMEKQWSRNGSPQTKLPITSSSSRARSLSGAGAKDPGTPTHRRHTLRMAVPQVRVGCYALLVIRWCC